MILKLILCCESWNKEPIKYWGKQATSTYLPEQKQLQKQLDTIAVTVSSINQSALSTPPDPLSNDYQGEQSLRRTQEIHLIAKSKAS